MTAPATVELAASGDAPAQLAWERYATPARWTEWAPHLTGVRCATPRIRPGATGVVRAAWVVPARFRVLAVDEDRRTWSWMVRSGPVRLRLEHGVQATPDGSRTTLTVCGPAAVVRAYAPVARWALRRLVREAPRRTVS